MPDHPLHTALESPDPRDALRAARLCAALPAQQLAAALLDVSAALVSGSAFHQRRAALVCGVLGRLAESLSPGLRALLIAPRWPVREAALHALAHVDPDSTATRNLAVIAALDRIAAVRRAALELLALHPGEVPPAFADAQTHHHPRVRCRALRAVARLAPAASIETLATALTHSHRRVRRTSAELLGEMGQMALPALGKLVRCRFDGDPTVALTARAALEKLQPHLPGVLTPLCGSQNNPIALWDQLRVSLSAETLISLETARRARLEHLLGAGASPDECAEARWLLGRLVALLTMPLADNP